MSGKYFFRWYRKTSTLLFVFARHTENFNWKNKIKLRSPPLRYSHLNYWTFAECSIYEQFKLQSIIAWVTLELSTLLQKLLEVSIYQYNKTDVCMNIYICSYIPWRLYDEIIIFYMYVCQKQIIQTIMMVENSRLKV